MSWSGLVGEADPFEPVVSYPRPVERSVFEGLLERHWDLFIEERCFSRRRGTLRIWKAVAPPCRRRWTVVEVNGCDVD